MNILIIFIFSLLWHLHPSPRSLAQLLRRARGTMAGAHPQIHLPATQAVVRIPQ